MAAIHAARAARARGAPPAVVALDGARSLGAKILVAGGGRCNVTHDVVDETSFCGSTPPAIRNVLRRFDVGRTVEFFSGIGIDLVREEGGKLFPASHRARDVLDALVGAAHEAGARIEHPWRVESVARDGPGFIVSGPAGTWRAGRVVLATGGQALPKSGSDGLGFALAKSLGLAVTPHLIPALVPLVVDEGCFIRRLSGIAVPVAIELRAGTGRRLVAMKGAALCTHFGLSGPAVLDISRHWILARRADPGAHLVVNWLPGVAQDELIDELARGRGATASGRLRAALPERLAEALLAESGVDRRAPLDRLARDARKRLATTVCAYRAPVTGARGFTYAEATAGGVPLSETRLTSLEARACPGLHAAGEILDVDGKIGGFNFQWAWSSGFVAGTAAGMPSV